MSAEFRSAVGEQSHPSWQDKAMEMAGMCVL